ncbi:MAG: quinone-dependent dihydroorotate dehydrogenase [Candidatus Paceibacterota bacterium]|jgi:dihydroorotate dehydrogenase subfamily 2
MIYKYILKPVFFLFNPEHVHDFMTKVGAILGNFSLTRWVIGLFYGYNGKDISKTVDGIKYSTPFLLSAGFDYNGHLMNILPYIGMGGEEVGSITAEPCEGNSKPRLTRLPKSKSIIVNKGLRNDGVDVIIARLKRGEASRRDLEASPRGRIGISIARTNCEESCSIEAGIEDYVYSFKRLNEENVGDYYTINISCPNAFGGEAFTTPELLNRLLFALRKIPCTKPIYVKMPINLLWTEFDALLKIIDSHGLNGVVIGNLNKNYEDLEYRDEAPNDYRGGLSGKPCAKLSTELIRKTKQAYSSRFTIIGVGGVMSPETAMEKFEAGADLVQLITGMIYEGPGLIKRLCMAYGALCK